MQEKLVQPPLVQVGDSVWYSKRQVPDKQNPGKMKVDAVCYLDTQEGVRVGIILEGSPKWKVEFVNEPQGHVNDDWTLERAMDVAARVAKDAGLPPTVHQDQGISMASATAATYKIKIGPDPNKRRF